MNKCLKCGAVNLTPREVEVLRFINQGRRHKYKVRQIDIAKHFKFPRQRAHQLWNRLVIKGYIPKGKP